MLPLPACPSSAGYVLAENTVLSTSQPASIAASSHGTCQDFPETFKGLGLSQQTAFCPQKAMLAGKVC